MNPTDWTCDIIVVDLMVLWAFAHHLIAFNTIGKNEFFFTGSEVLYLVFDWLWRKTDILFHYQERTLK